jgi:hypothetical protein
MIDAVPRMGLDETERIVEVQHRILIRLAELGYVDADSANRISRHLAEISILGQAFGQTTLPLFLTLNRNNSDALAQLAVSLKCDLEELGDALVDVDSELQALIEFLNCNSQTP